ncbi:nuclear factor erythroid 2-related factor 3 [Cololabis saira]|uniref:nuclear factor erythroid 2-related factor 3 n=1 Tax=Cololabis saira TaxID=129043 RepID=UPI002AD2275D|nr:nuclear factor erythroid 2-related factor 3 [Cololabis saira]
MQKKYLADGLIQLTILLSFIGVRVDLDSYLSGYYQPPPADINLGASSAYVQTPFHLLRDTLDGYGVHPKCPELDHFFASRRLLHEVRRLGSPRFPTRLSAWLVHQVSEAGPPASNHSTAAGGLHGLQGPGDGPGDDDTEGGRAPDPGPGHGPGGADAPVLPLEEDEVKIKEEEEPVSVTQLTHSSTLEQENLLGGITALSNPTHDHPPLPSTDIDWTNLLYVSGFDDLDSLVSDRLPDLDTDITNAISQDVSLHDAMITGTGVFEASGRTGSRTLAQQQRTLLRLESTGSSHSNTSSGMASGSTALPFAAVCNFTGDVTPQSALGGCLDEAVFDQINQLGLGCLDPIDDQLMSSWACIDPRVLEDLDSDSGLSLESSSGGPASPGSSEMSSSSSSSYCEDDCGATGYSSEVESVTSKVILNHNSSWSPVDLSDSVWHDHSYSSPALLSKASLKLPHIKEPLSDDYGEDFEDRELSRDELRARAMCIPFSAFQIVNMPVEEFMEVLDTHGFSAEQVTLLRDIRRRGKNKLAAQNCRKRKLDAITGLQEEVERLQAQRDRLLREKQLTAKTMGAVGQQIKQLTRDVLARLRDDSGRPLNPERFTLQCGANGRVVVQPLTRPAVSTSAGNKTDKRKKEKKQ